MMFDAIAEFQELTFRGSDGRRTYYTPKRYDKEFVQNHPMTSVNLVHRRKVS
jgi:hypothetical protein